MSAFLEKWPWFRALSQTSRALVLETARERHAAAGTIIARAGEPSAHWYGLMRGLLQMYVVGADGAETTLYCLREGEWGGEGSLLKAEMRRYDLRALTPAHICLIPARTFEALRRESLAFNHFLTGIMNKRMGAFVGMLAATRLLAPEMRVARALLMLTDAHSEAAQELPVPQHELALISGLSRQRVNVALAALRHEGVVAPASPRGPLVVNPARLRVYVMEAR
ncbi:Crp/Fnr family transcriptional regulator [Paracoccus sp. MC1854]|uniref:Crp/Fnr family transcriptional regulator n=1 Tax=Paracoccus sp. MC1854 TaxID=2760306 RepID=UPI00160171A6|nr:Crp/Fnr family transcriptional regulator [Paracoccus sp. MC1854]MBB1492694.1 Crp/Fnr family transcriptional regulator [Paracoccus sp. MC1854]